MNIWEFKYTPGPWLVWFSFVRFSFVRIFKTNLKYLIHAVYPLFDRVNPSFVRKPIRNLTTFVCLFVRVVNDRNMCSKHLLTENPRIVQDTLLTQATILLLLLLSDVIERYF